MHTQMLINRLVFIYFFFFLIGYIFVSGAKVQKLFEYFKELLFFCYVLNFYLLLAC